MGLPGSPNRLENVVPPLGEVKGSPKKVMRGDYLAIVTLAFGEIVAAQAQHGKA